MKSSPFNIRLVHGYKSSSQKIRILSEDWVFREGYCPSCGKALLKAQDNSPVLDFSCPACAEDFELKSKENHWGTKIVDGAYKAMMARLSSDTHPSLFLLNYRVRDWAVVNFLVIPKHFFVTDLVERRKPLASTARRAGWTGCNLLLDRIPNAGRIFFVRDSKSIPRQEVLRAWKDTLFLREEENKKLKGWILAVMKCIDAIQNPEFRLDEVYAFEEQLKEEYPNNRHVKDKIRQQLQYLRDFGYLEFLGRGRYRKMTTVGGKYVTG